MGKRTARRKDSTEIHVYSGGHHWVSLYALCDIQTHEVRYIGVTCHSLKKRFQKHLHDAKYGKTTHKTNWIRSVHNALEIVLIKDYSSYKEALKDEVWFIALHRAMGSRLTNTTAGGCGVKYIEPKDKSPVYQTAEFKDKISKIVRYNMSKLSKEDKIRKFSNGTQFPEATVTSILELFKTGLSLREISRRLNISHTAVSKHLKRAKVFI